MAECERCKQLQKELDTTRSRSHRDAAEFMMSFNNLHSGELLQLQVKVTGLQNSLDRRLREVDWLERQLGECDQQGFEARQLLREIYDENVGSGGDLGWHLEECGYADRIEQLLRRREEDDEES